MMSKSRGALLGVYSLAVATTFLACGPKDSGSGDGADSADEGDGANDINLGTGGGGEMATKGCADGILTEDEVCDDGNRDDGDGCRSTCLGIEPGFTCPTPGQLCLPFAKCGDGIANFPEQCDDGATMGGDGCSANCKVEVGFKCSGNPSTCTPTTCGDGVMEGAETCDDSNQLPFDGCSADCIGEPQCSGGACTSACGDGIVLTPEACDDGNTTAGDGCSPTCTVEDGYECTQGEDCETDASGNCVLPVPVIFRDFSYTHSDFNESSCSGSGATTGLVEDQLNGGKPVRVGNGSNMCMTGFGDWYTDQPGKNVTFSTQLVLYDDGAGNYVNRHGANGERWVTTMGSACPSMDCEHDGSPFFFPVDSIPGALNDGGETAAVSTSEYSMDGTLFTEQQLTGSSPLRNFAFTSEVTYWFQYQADQEAQLTFLGDDDVWVFVAGHLAVDLGGLHQAISGSVTINASTASGFGLEDGKIYKINVFHAERKPKGSTFRLTLSGFSTSRSDCQAVCGDGIVGFGEECDDGTNDGGYNQCQPGCILGSYCGDGIKQDDEQCDDNDPAAPPECNGCRIVVVK